MFVLDCGTVEKKENRMVERLKGCPKRFEALSGHKRSLPDRFTVRYYEGYFCPVSTSATIFSPVIVVTSIKSERL